MGFPEMRPLSFPKATKLPEKVTVPIKHESTILIPSPRGDVTPSESNLKSSAAATSAEAAPPKPLNIQQVRASQSFVPFLLQFHPR